MWRIARCSFVCLWCSACVADDSPPKLGGSGSASGSGNATQSTTASSSSETDSGETTTQQTETGETGEPHWCQACNEAPDGSECLAATPGELGVVVNPPLVGPLDEFCTVTTATASTLAFACPSVSLTIDTSDLTPSWSPSFAPGDMMQVLVDEYVNDPEGYLWWSVYDLFANFVIGGVDSDIGALAITNDFEITVVDGVCVPDCGESVVYEDVALSLTRADQQLTLFHGQHGQLDGFDIWVLLARQRVCDMDGGYPPMPTRIAVAGPS